LVALFVVAACLVLIVLEVPIGLAITGAGLLGITLLFDPLTAAQVLAEKPYAASAKYGLFVIPMYVLLGSLISNVGIGEGIYRFTNRLVRRLPGGLPATAVLATALFSGISGSSAADVATFGRVSVTEMSRHGYERAYAAAVVAAAGTFAVLIPPSIVLVVYAILAEVSIGAMILAGVVPGILSALILVAFVMIRAWLGRRPTAAGAAESGSRSPAPAWPVGRWHPDRPAGLLQAERPPVMSSSDLVPAAGGPSATLRSDLPAVFYAVVLFGIVVGGLYLGVFTATEAGAVGAFAALVIALIARRYRTERLRTVLVRAFAETANVTSMIFLILVGGAIFTYFVAASQLATDFTQWTLRLNVSPLAVVAIFLLVMLVLGTFLDGLSTLLLTVPLAAPVVDSLGIDGIWFGILTLKIIEIGLITPPVGLNVYIIAGITGVPAESIFRRAVPFVVLDLVVTAAFFAFPGVVTWLPGLAGQT
jgi:TRAP-type C4-dicarboxylate transport system permease large subunit